MNYRGIVEVLNYKTQETVLYWTVSLPISSGSCMRSFSPTLRYETLVRYLKYICDTITELVQKPC